MIDLLLVVGYFVSVCLVALVSGWVVGWTLDKMHSQGEAL